MTRRVHAGLLLTSLLTLSLPAAADDGKSSPAAICQEVGQNQHHFEYTSRAALMNRAAERYQVVCPVVRDSMQVGVEWVEVVALDYHFSSDVSCSFYSRNRLGNDGWVSSASTRGVSNLWQRLRFADDLRAFDEGLYYFTCYVPGVYQGFRSGLASYMVQENG